MYTQSDYERTYNEFLTIQKQRQSVLKKVWGGLLLLTLGLIALIIVLFPEQFNDGSTSWILPTYGGMLLVTTLGGFLISINYKSEKPYFEFLFPDIYHKINLNEGIYLKYVAYDKESKSFNKVGGLFTGFASVKVKRHISGDSSNQNKFDIFDCIMTTSSGKSQQTHFKGVYFVLQKQLNTTLQIRSNGSPKLKGIKFTRQEDFNTLKVYKESAKTMLNIDHMFVRFMEKLAEDPNNKKVYLSIVDGQIHMGIWYKNNPGKKENTVTIDTMNKWYKYFISETKIIEQIAEIDPF